MKSGVEREAEQNRVRQIRVSGATSQHNHMIHALTRAAGDDRDAWHSRCGAALSPRPSTPRPLTAAASVTHQRSRHGLDCLTSVLKIRGLANHGVLQ